MADSPNKNTDGVVTFTIKIDGEKAKDTVQLLSIEVRKSLNKIASATLHIVDGDMPTQDFPISNEDYFIPGKAIEITAGYASNEALIFSGIVVRHGISIAGQQGSMLVVECKDKAVAMTVARKNVNYVDQKDSDIISTLLSSYAGLESDVEATTAEFPELVQYNCTDWDFILTRAEANGLIVCADDNKVTIQSPQIDTAVLTVTYGEDLMEFNADIDARYQYSSVKAASWDMATQAVIEQTEEPQTLNAQGDLSSSTLSEVLELGDLNLQTGTAFPSEALTSWAKGQQVKSALAKIRGNMKFQGSAKAKLGTIIEVKGVGTRFNGDLYISAVNHHITNGQWETEVEFGMSPNWSADYRDLAAPPASGLLPAVEGLQVGVVMKLDEDPEGENRIQVKVPILQADSEGVWARLGSYYASAGFGNFFIPEVDDEVVLGYFNNNPSDPVILGSLYSSKKTPPYELSADNNIKAIVTKSELKIEFDDEKKVTTIVTPGNNTVVLNDDEKSIVLADQNGNKVELTDSGINLESPKDISIKADGKISMDATGEISLASKADLTAEGMNVSLTAKTGFTATGSATAEVSASGQTTIKGAMVMIN